MKHTQPLPLTQWTIALALATGAGFHGPVGLAQAQNPNQNRSAVYDRIFRSSPQAQAILNQSGDVALFDQGAIAVSIRNNRQVFQPIGQPVSSLPGTTGKAIRGKVKDIKTDPMGRFPMRWMSPDIIAFKAEWADAGAPAGVPASRSGLVAWSEAYGASLVSVCDFSTGDGQGGLLHWDATETGSWGCVGGSSDTGYQLVYSRQIDDPSTSFGFPIQMLDLSGAGKVTFDPFSITRFQCFPGRGVIFDGIPEGTKELVTVESHSQIFTSVQAPYQLRQAIGRDTVGGVDDKGNFAIRGQLEGSVPSTPDQTFDGEVACSLNGHLATFVSHQGQGPYEAVSPVKGVGVVIKKNTPPPTARLRPTDVMVNDDGAVCWTEREGASVSLKMDNGAQTVTVLQTGQRLFGSTLSSFTVQTEQNFNIHNACAVTYTLQSGQSGVMTVTLDCPILRSVSPLFIEATGKDTQVVLSGEFFDPRGGDTINIIGAKGQKIKTKSNIKNDRIIVITVPGNLLTEEGDLTFEITGSGNGLKTKTYTGHVTLMK